MSRKHDHPVYCKRCGRRVHADERITRLCAFCFEELQMLPMELPEKPKKDEPPGK